MLAVVVVLAAGCSYLLPFSQVRARAKLERAAGKDIQSCQFFPIFSGMAGLIRSGLYTGNDQYVGQNVKFIKVF